MINHVKLSKTSNRKVGKKKYYKFIVTIPIKYLEELKWDEKTILNMKICGKKLVLEKG